MAPAARHAAWRPWSIVVAILIATVPVALGWLALRAPAARAEATTETTAQFLVESAARWYPWLLAAWLIDRRTRQAATESRWPTVFAHAGTYLAFGLAHGTLAFAVSALIASPERMPFLSAVGGQLVPDAVLYAGLTAGFTVAESRRRRTEITERLRAEVAEARLDALRQQLNPHFLFNTLNHIVTELRDGAVEPALQMLLALSELLHDVLRERAQVIPLADELRIVERYLEIERARFGDRLDVVMAVEPRALGALVPTLILQPLIENATRYGISTDDGRCRLRVSARVEGQQLAIDVRDDGPGLAAAPHERTGIGLSNTRERLRYLYGSAHSFEIHEQERGGVSVALRLPLQRATTT